MEKKKYGWTEKGIVGFIFLPIGVVFLLVCAVLLQLGALLPEEKLVFLLSFGIIGAVFSLLGAVFLGMELRRRRRERAAFEGGYCVMAKIAGVRGNARVNMNGAHPVQVECHYIDPDTGVAHVYYSRYLYVNVAGLLQGEEVPLYLDRMGSGAGFVDIDAVLPKIAVHR